MSFITVVGALIVDSIDAPTKVLAARRSGTHAGYWEFPGGKVEPGESPQSALTREVHEELQLSIEVRDEVESGSGGWTISDTLILRLFIATAANGEAVAGAVHDQVRWIGPDEIDDLEWLPSDRAALVSVQERLGW